MGLIGGREMGLRRMGLIGGKQKQWFDRRWVSVEMEDWAEWWVGDMDRRLGAWVGLGGRWRRRSKTLRQIGESD